MKKFKFNRNYLLTASIIFAIEVLIALYVHDGFIRPYAGDTLVVILIYAFLKSFWNKKPTIVAMLVLLFAFVVETLQYFRFIDLLGLEDIQFFRVVLGTSFAWADMAAYFVGFLLILLAEKIIPFGNISAYKKNEI